ncbi:hypothetical protein B0T26DRAFT_747549 [Lasiosphaeria miniovina]|uniref:Uncharacterized protein n=1 Tax=Lasiosphaeria miniovina TaxID=1954250 RepID=A0AA40B3V5_9PEZI|nr:uncharacterized protein B0T26DRAFT_747549 [Lasiosphaeria miniovina]KAK0727198.1 hypothetical protein B0T26DRAFT_747549 [Lasiosphaeria miniovina]
MRQTLPQLRTEVKGGTQALCRHTVTTPNVGAGAKHTETAGTDVQSNGAAVERNEINVVDAVDRDTILVTEWIAIRFLTTEEAVQDVTFRADFVGNGWLDESVDEHLKGLEQHGKDGAVAVALLANCSYGGALFAIHSALMLSRRS